MGHSEYAPNLFLVAHDSFTGRMEVSRELVHCGLVASELAYLVIERRLGMAEERVVPIAEPPVAAPARELRGTPAAEIDEYVVASVKQQETNHSVRVWAESLGEVIYGLIADDLVAQGVVRRERRRSSAGAPRTGSPRWTCSGRAGRGCGSIDDPGAGDVHPGGSGQRRTHRRARHREIARDGITKEFVEELNRNLPSQLQMLMAGAAGAAAAVSLTVRRWATGACRLVDRPDPSRLEPGPLENRGQPS